MRIIDDEKRSQDDSELVDYFFAIDKVKIDVNKHIGAEESKFILARVNESKVKSKVVWAKVIAHFDYGDEKARVLKKIQDHYYNRRAGPYRAMKKKIEFHVERVIKIIKTRLSRPVKLITI